MENSRFLTGTTADDDDFSGFSTSVSSELPWLRSLKYVGFVEIYALGARCVLAVVRHNICKQLQRSPAAVAALQPLIIAREVHGTC